MGIGEKTGSEQRADTTRDFVCKRRDTRGPVDPLRTMAYVIFVPCLSRSDPPLSFSLSSLSLTRPFTRSLSLSLSPRLQRFSCTAISILFSLSTPCSIVRGVSREKRSILEQVIGHCSSVLRVPHVSKSDLGKNCRISNKSNISR